MVSYNSWYKERAGYMKSGQGPTKIKRILRGGCVIFTFAVFLFYLFGDTILPDIVPVMTLKTVSCFLAFSFLVSAFNSLLRAKKPSAGFRYILHFAGIMTSFAVIFLGIYNFGETGARNMIFFFIAILVYVAIMLLRWLFTALYRKSPFYISKDL